MKETARKWTASAPSGNYKFPFGASTYKQRRSASEYILKLGLLHSIPNLDASDSLYFELRLYDQLGVIQTRRTMTPLLCCVCTPSVRSLAPA